MAYQEKKREMLAFKNSNRAWVMAELKKLFDEWEAWAKFVQTIEDHPFDRNTQSEIFADGVENLDKHDILRTKTLTFLDNNIQGHNFMRSNEYEEPFERTDLRLILRVPHRIKDLKVLLASLEYALVPDGFWKERGKSLLNSIEDKAPDSALRIVESYLRNPTQG
ncbi:hypothetical protein [Parasedimentitalea denitrificans]|uniref:hypothetical protein n=1 Tax=Parasedimentitalea denitrificans TaxID=2211118 RepID=UPI0014309C52|nr:hypothetical protein [Sedimentitalea sp. CY04]